MQLSATPVTGAVFNGWSGSATGADNPLTITMDAAKTVTANFIQDPASSSFALTPSADPGSLGTVSGGGVYKSGTTATITAVLQ